MIVELIKVADDPELPMKIYQRACMLELTNPFGPRDHDDWSKVYTWRHKTLGEPLKNEFFIVDGTIDWQKSGHYRLLPECPPDKDPPTHMYEWIVILDFKACVSGIDATWYIEKNWSAATACVQHPSKRVGRSMLCASFFEVEHIQKLMKPLDFSQGIGQLMIVDGQVEPNDGLRKLKDGETGFAAGGASSTTDPPPVSGADRWSLQAAGAVANEDVKPSIENEADVAPIEPSTANEDAKPPEPEVVEQPGGAAHHAQDDTPAAPQPPEGPRPKRFRKQEKGS